MVPGKRKLFVLFCFFLYNKTKANLASWQPMGHWPISIGEGGGGGSEQREGGCAMSF